MSPQRTGIQALMMLVSIVVSTGNAPLLCTAKDDRHREALGLLQSASAALETGRLDTAATDFARSATMLEAMGDRFSAWLAWGQLGNVERLRGHPSEALAHFERSLSLLQVIAGSSEPLAPETLEYLGLSSNALRSMNTSPAEARSRILQLAEGMSRAGIVGSLLDSGQLERAEKELAQLMELSRPLGGRLAREVAIHHGELRQKQGAFAEAREIFLKLLGEAASASKQEMAAILKSLTEIDAASGRFEEALAWNDKALDLARRSGPKEESAVLLLRAGILQKSQRPVEATKAFGEALEAAQRSGSEDQQALIHQELGTLELDAGRDEGAAAHFEAAARLFHSAGRPEREALTWISLFQIYSRLDSRASADAALEKARALAANSDSPLVEALMEFTVIARQAQAGKSDIRELREKLSKLLALPELREGRRGQEGQVFLDLMAGLERSLGEPTAAPTPSVADAAKARASLGLPEWPELLQGFDLLRREEFAAARDVLSTALARRQGRDIEIVLLVGIAVSYIAEGNGQEALSYLTRAVDAVEKGTGDVRLEEFLAGYLSSHQDIFTMLIELLAAFGRTDEAFEYAERARARAFLQGLGNPRLAPTQGADAELVREAETLRQQILDIERRMIPAAVGERERLSNELQQARDRYQALLVRLKVTSPTQAFRAKVEPQPVPAIREQLGRETSLVSYYASPLRVHAWVLDNETLQHVALPFGSQQLGRAVCWAERIARRSGGRGVERLSSACGDEIASAEELYQQLIHPLRRWIRHRRLIIVPHGELHYLPFAALRNPETGRYLIEDYTLTYAPSASGLGFLRARETPVEGKALVIGAPEELDPRWNPLPAARQEADLVGRLLGTRPLFGKQASEGRLSKRSGTIDLLHVAAHGLYEPRNPLFSRIALAPDPQHDGNLEVHEILSDLDLSGVNLVVLSACETARGERSRGDEITGLTRAFLYAGSPGVISTLWNIDDEATAVLMKDFYHRLLDGAAVPDALREAQLRLLHGRRFRDPYFWAAFSLTGDPQGRWRRQVTRP
jgi:CHAT domain-containing protein